MKKEEIKSLLVEWKQLEFGRSPHGFVNHYKIQGAELFSKFLETKLKEVRIEMTELPIDEEIAKLEQRLKWLREKKQKRR